MTKKSSNFVQLKKQILILSCQLIYNIKKHDTMDQSDIDEIIDYVNKKYTENVPRPVRFVVRKKSKMIEDFDVGEMPTSLRNCTIEQYIEIIKDALRQGTLKF